MNQREIRRIANLRASMMIEGSLNYGWEPDDLIAEIGQDNVDKVKDEVANIADELRKRVGPASGSHLDWLRQRIEAEGGVWSGNRVVDVYRLKGVYTLREKAVADLRMIASYFPGLLTPVAGEKNSWEVVR